MGVAQISNWTPAQPGTLLLPILPALTGEGLAALPPIACSACLWDVLGACERKGNQDAAIRKSAANDFGRLRELRPLPETVGFNDHTWGKFEPQLAAQVSAR